MKAPYSETYYLVSMYRHHLQHQKRRPRLFQNTDLVTPILLMAPHVLHLSRLKIFVSHRQKQSLTLLSKAKHPQTNVPEVALGAGVKQIVQVSQTLGNVLEKVQVFCWVWHYLEKKFLQWQKGIKGSLWPKF